jgi:hypothetical protein
MVSRHISLWLDVECLETITGAPPNRAPADAEQRVSLS